MVIIEKENFSVSQICSSGQCFRLDPADETGKVYELTAGRPIFKNRGGGRSEKSKILLYTRRI